MTSREKEDYNSLLQNNLIETDSKCLSCGGDAVLRYMKLDSVEPEVVITVFECKTCNIKETNMFNSNENTEEALLIKCRFDSLDDLKRQINLNKNTGLSIKYQDLDYTFESSESQVYTVEGIIQQAIKNLGGEGNGFSTIRDTERLERSLDQLREILVDPTFELIIEDKVGLSRVGPVGEDLYKIQGKELSYFNDEKVQHKKMHEN